MRRRAAQLSLAIVAVIVGVLLIGQLRSQAPAIELSGLSAQELSDLIGTLRAGNAQLSDALTDVRQQVSEYERLDVAGQSTLTLTGEDVIRFSAFAGLLAVEGQGIVMDIDGQFQPANVNDLIHELRNAGAEAIAIDDVRITASSVPVRGTGAIAIDGVEIGNPFRVTAIGSPDGLTAALERPGGILSLFEHEIDASWAIIQREHVTVPATQRDLTPQVAEPVE
ncbi:MAG TPA: DUF881 domain-containing protein [Candidatus Limnocylindria bacterium]